MSAMTDDVNRLLLHRAAWKRKKTLRAIYTAWYRRIAADMSSVRGATIEIGCGTGNFKEFAPATIASDILFCPWSDITFDAHRFPVHDTTVSNIVMVDALHHLARPTVFLEEACRVLKPGGRIIALEPFPSPLSLMVYRAVHPEPFVMDADVFSVDGSATKDAWQANQAIPYLLFFRHAGQFTRTYGSRLAFVKKCRTSIVAYALTGGFEHRALIPDSLITALHVAERVLAPLLPLMAFRCYVVLERT